MIGLIYYSCITVLWIMLLLFLPQYCWYHHSVPTWLAKVKSGCVLYPTGVVCRYNVDTYFLPKWTKYILLLCTW